MLSLRLTIGALSALAVAVVASVTLGIALTTSFAALRDLGTRHVEALMLVADRSTSVMFSRGTDAVLAMGNVTATTGSATPSERASRYSRIDAGRTATQTALLRGLPDVQSASLYFRDSSEFLVSAFNTVIVGGTETSYYVGAKVPTYPNATTFDITERCFDLNTNRPDSAACMEPRLTNISHYEQGIWYELNLATFNSFAPVIVPPRASQSAAGNLMVFVGSVLPIVNVSIPEALRDRSSVLGFAAATVSIDRIRSFLLEARSTPNTAAFAYDGAGYLLAATPDLPMVDVRPSAAGFIPSGCTSTADLDRASVGTAERQYHVCRRNIAHYGYAPLADVVRSHADLVYPPLGSRPVRRAALEGGTAYVTSSRVPLAFRGMELYLLLILPEADVLGDVITGRNVAIGVTCGLVVLFAVLNVALVMALLAPLSGIAERMNRAASFDDDGEDESVSAMSEVAELQRAYYAMNDELNRIRSYVPQSVLVARRREQEDDDGDVDADVIGSTADLSDTQSNVSRRSRRSNRVSTSEGTAYPMDAVYAAATDASGAIGALSQRAVTVVCGNLVGLHEAVSRSRSQSAADAAAAEIAAAAGLFEAEVAAHQGVLTFHGDRFLATFNSARPCASHASRGLQTALAVTAAGGSAHGGGPRCRVACGVDTGRCAVGSMGSATMKALSTVGPAVANAAALERLTRERCADAVAEGFASRWLLATNRTIGDAPLTGFVAVHCDVAPLQTWTMSKRAIVSLFLSAEELQRLEAPDEDACVPRSQQPSTPQASPNDAIVDGAWLYHGTAPPQLPTPDSTALTTVLTINAAFSALHANASWTEATTQVSGGLLEAFNAALVPSCIRRRFNALRNAAGNM